MGIIIIDHRLFANNKFYPGETLSNLKNLHILRFKR